MKEVIYQSDENINKDMYIFTDNGEELLSTKIIQAMPI